MAENNNTEIKKRKRMINKPLRLQCAVKNYNWGIVGNKSHVSRLFYLNSGTHINPNEPYAEFWIGTHESGASFLDHGGLSLKEWISKNPDVLGDRVLNKWGGDLPFLFKVLSVEKALSIQAHPDKELARTLHKSQPSLYSDENHKPEMALALTEFEALCGFISLKELRNVLCTVPEIVDLVGGADAEQCFPVNEFGRSQEVKAIVESIFSQILLSSKDEICEIISRLKWRLNLEKKKRQLTDKEMLVLRLEGQYPDDAGVLAAFLLNYVKLNRGEALCIGANEPHAYIRGECIECMATSDNVVRAGLTSKHRDIQTLFSMLNRRQGFPQILKGISLNPYTTRYLPPFEEFEVDCCVIPQAASLVFPSVAGPSLFLFISGNGTLSAGFSKEQIVEEGEVLFVPAYMEFTIASQSKELHLYRAGVNSSFFQAF
ncbi:mannose-6-phosphate isomerase 1-like [Citrus sinensis]|uniref:mannose-6-phosphate isomerase n=1 Tax=Citrus sinensis TaxID=2711 RepID=A0A9E8ABD6_CITSI|nr:mannose-6-phosphate isomerase 1-like [Citrus sinensis]UYW66322.1 phosphomannose-isomerase [Citrus sinensis]